MPNYAGFCGGSYVAQSPYASNERTVNFYLERQEIPTGKSRDVLYSIPGVSLLTTHTNTGGRAHFAQAGREFCVIGSSFLEVNAAGTVMSRGTVALDQYPATICSNGDAGGQVFVTSGNNGYIFDLGTNTFTLVRTGATRMGVHLDGFFLALDADTSTVYISDSNNGLTWDPTQFIQRSDRPDPWIAMYVLGRYLWFLGTETSSVWYNAGTAPIPFQQHPSGSVDQGIAAAFSGAVVAGGLMWLAATADGRGAVVRAEGFTPDVVSTFALQTAFASYGDLDAAIGDAYEDLGHAFYLLTIPSSITWAYDATPTLGVPNAMRWAERGTWISAENRYVPWRPMFHAFAFGQHRMLDRESGALYRLTSDVCVDVEEKPLRRVRRPPVLNVNTLKEIELGVEAGLGLVSGQGSNPLVMMRMSRDGGKTFGAERSRSAGALGHYDTRVFWNRCGSAKYGKGLQPEFVMTDPIPWRITGATFEAA